MLQEQLEGCGYDGRSDVWSLGCLMYELCTLTPPFTASSQWQLVARIKLGHAHRLPTHYSTKLDAIVRSLLHTKVSGCGYIRGGEGLHLLHNRMGGLYQRRRGCILKM